MRIDKNYTFYLGGYDAEMYEIRKILEHHNLSFFDKNLSWGAKASDYKDNLNSVKKTEIPVLIELTIDMPIPLNTIIIDHHNENESKPSSVEQIAVLLGIELNRWQKLIAANDKGYIPAMKNICASTIEIKEIREFDRKAQGVTEEDEKLAEESIIKNKKEQNGITIIKSLTEKFSPIADRMYGKTSNLLVYTDEALTYYGEKKKQILNKFNNLVDGGKAYYGGKDFGFFGLAKGKVTNDEVIEIKNEILEMKPEMNEKLYSHHIFIFPFKWRKWKVDDQSLLHDKFDVEFFLEELKSSNWEPKPFDLNLPDRYNEYNYFYDYVSEILYDLSDELTTNDIDKNLINHFEYNLKNDTYYNIKLCGIEEPLTLIIDSILLNIYSTGTAVLSFHLRNHKYDSKEDILKINKYGRRLFVPFFDLQPDSIYTGKNDKTNVDRILYATKKNEIPDAIWIGNKELEKDDKHCYEDFEKYKDKTNYKHKPFLLPRFIDGLFPDNFFLSAEQNGYLNYTQKTKDTRFKIHLSPVLDDRMHVVCWYGNTDLVNQLNKIKECNDLDLGSHYVKKNIIHTKQMSGGTVIFLLIHLRQCILINLSSKNYYTRILIQGG
ncbi:MAG: hypothetical protein IPH11_15515 [Ignavibacteriales bacterium]|nr:hypothetical protein [Ignavibacteriales bacterium]